MSESVGGERPRGLWSMRGGVLSHENREARLVDGIDDSTSTLHETSFRRLIEAEIAGNLRSTEYTVSL
jgi:hypothetical protein